MIFEPVATGGCRSYLIGCAEACVGALIDPHIPQVDHCPWLRATACASPISSTPTPTPTTSPPPNACRTGRIPGSAKLPRGQLELRVNRELPDPTRRIVVACEFGMVSTLAAATLRELGFPRAVGLDGGLKAWRELSLPLETGEAPP